MDSTTEADVLKRISRDRLMETNRNIAQWVRLSGSQDERSAFEYIQSRLRSYGLETTWEEHPALISYPLEAELAVLDGNGNTVASFKCLTHAFSASVDNLEAEIVDLGYGTPADYAQTNVRGKIVLLNGLASPTGVYNAERGGAVGEVFINDDHLHNMIVSTVWGTPTPESAPRLPTTPAVSVVAADGRVLRERIAAQPTRVRIRTRVFRDWQTTPIVTGTIASPASEDFVMLSGHLDSWDYGAMDNGSANATMLEVARVIAVRPLELERGLRVIFWSGHSHGRYSGSTWYADHHWEELADHCVAHVNVDSTGAQGATFYGTFQTHMELADLGAGVIREYTGQAARPVRMSRAGDMSFNGIGIPALFMELSQVPLTETNRNYVTESLGTIMGSTMPWWWHTADDTMDKVDAAVLELDTRVYAAAVWRLVTSPGLPFDFRPVVGDIVRKLDELQRIAGDHFDLGLLRDRAASLAASVDRLQVRALAAASRPQAAHVNEQMKRLSRALIPITYAASGRFEHDPAWGIPFLPRLQPLRTLPDLAPRRDEYLMLKTALTREANGIAYALRQAREAIQE